MLQIELIGYTDLKTEHAKDTVREGWLIRSLSNLALSLGNPADPVDTEVILDDRFWKDKCLPDDVLPAFETCNVSRTYQLEVKIGILSGSSLASAASEILLQKGSAH